ncbi:prevent-host-death family protein [Treponema pedis]|nr:type II toxin-antitoxin system Phd/YefM family antitoxin [Treponema pedis]
MLYVIFGGNYMMVMTATQARSNLHTLIDKTKNFHEPIIISGKRHNAVLISEEDWNSIQETLYLYSVPGLRESIIEASKEPLENSIEDIGW